jgi:hypothetical protein
MGIEAMANRFREESSFVRLGQVKQPGSAEDAGLGELGVVAAGDNGL